MTRNHAGGVWPCLQIDLSPAAASRRLAGDLIEACVPCPTQPCPGRSTRSTRGRLRDRLDGGNRGGYHKEAHVAVALSRIGAQLDSCKVEATLAGYERLSAWAAALGRPVFGVEG
jgi:hypothetical protein